MAPPHEVLVAATPICFLTTPGWIKVSLTDTCQSFTEPWRTYYCPTYASFTPESYVMLSAYKHIFSFMTAERVTKLLQQIEQLIRYSEHSTGCNTEEMSGTQQAQLFFVFYKPNDATEWTLLVLFSGIKRPGCEIYHSQPPRAEARHAQSYASNPSLNW